VSVGLYMALELISFNVVLVIQDFEGQLSKWIF
jgi:hypothetical protein